MSSSDFPNYPQLKGTILIVTYGRSGSTLLQSLLQTIPDCHIRGENFGALEGMFRTGRRLKRAKKVWGAVPRAHDHPWYGADQLAPARFERRMGRLFLQDVLAPPQTARWTGFKEIRFQMVRDDFDAYLNFCGRIFPNTFFVFNSRNLSDVATSRWWQDQNPAEVHRNLGQLDELFASYHAKHPQRSFHAVHESTISDPSTALAPLFDLLGETADAAAMSEVLNKRLTH